MALSRACAQVIFVMSFKKDRIVFKVLFLSRLRGRGSEGEKRKAGFPKGKMRIPTLNTLTT